MKFSTDKNTLLAGITGVCDVAKSITESDITREMLRNIKMEAKGNTLLLTGTDSDITIKNNIFVDVEKEGAF